MNIYTVVIDGESWNVVASTLLSAIRATIKEENSDRDANNYCRLDQEIKYHPLVIEIELKVANATEKEMEPYFEEVEENDSSPAA